MKTGFLNLLVVLLTALLSLGCSTDSENRNNTEILGEWNVVAIHNSSPSGPTLGPNSGEVISIRFGKNGDFSGTTSANSFGGQYDTSRTLLFIEEMTTTEVADTNYGQAFYEAFNESRNTETKFSEFEIKVQDENTVHLEYQSFKFLTLQKQ